MSNKIVNNIVLIADRINKFKDISIKNNNLELIEDDYYIDMINSLSHLCLNLHKLCSPKELIEIAPSLIPEETLVFPIWSGFSSRNRRALIPSICEAYKLMYVGADAFASILCQDKIMSKKFAQRFGFKTPSYIVYDGNEGIVKLIKNLSYPVVIKPALEGGSIGISSSNLIKNSSDVLRLAKELFLIYNQPIIIEEFKSGKEASIVILGTSKRIELLEVVSLKCPIEIYDIENNIYSFEIKKDYDKCIDFKYDLITSNIPSEVINAAQQLFFSLGKVDTLRIDGRYNEKKEFHMIELSPDIHYGRGSFFSEAFRLKGMSYDATIESILINSLRNFN